MDNAVAHPGSVLGHQCPGPGKITMASLTQHVATHMPGIDDGKPCLKVLTFNICHTASLQFGKKGLIHVAQVILESGCDDQVELFKLF